jgi:predicted MFS family arabinose efflux permease
MDFMVMMPLGPQIMQAFNLSPALFATAVSTYSWCAGISGLLAATYIDRFDRRSLMLVVYALFAFSNLLCALAPTFELLLISRAFAGLSGGVFSAIILSIVGDIIPYERRGAAMGIIMTGFSLAAIAGVPAGVILSAYIHWSAAFYLLVGLSLAIWLVSYQLVPALNEHLSQRPAPLKQILPNLVGMISAKRNLHAYILTFIMMMSHMLVIPLFHLCWWPMHRRPAAFSQLSKQPD